ncbi:MAG TPA: glycoside hydrolase family protein, partial [Draconibacterium sp.]|nr:glycoside hydrolase family protein [Draconibacterium sp.]
MIFRILWVFVLILLMGSASNENENKAFIDKLGPSVKNGGFKMEGYWVWGASVIRGEDGKYYAFASRWPKKYPFFNGYIFYSEVVRAVSDKPEGPFAFQEVVLKPRGSKYWDGRTTHNPTIHKSGDTYLLYYIGTTYEGDGPT